MPSRNDVTIRHHLDESAKAMTRAAADERMIAAIADAAALIAKALAAGGKLLIAGNGGSAADAQHFAAELVGRYRKDRKAMAAIALTTDTSALTAIGNDYGFERIFSRQIEALGRPQDVLLAISTSGRSANIVAALDMARSMGMKTVGFTGEAGDAMRPLCDVLLTAPARETALIQQIHIAAVHAICGQLEDSL